MMSLHDAGQSSMPMLPQSLRRPAWKAHPEVRRVHQYLWIIFILVLLWFFSLLTAIKIIGNKCRHAGFLCVYTDLYSNVYESSSWSLFPDLEEITSLAETKVMDDAGGHSHAGLPQSAGLAVTILVVMHFLSSSTMGLH